MQPRHLKFEAQVPFRRRSPGSIFAGGGHFELPHARALQAAAVELKELRSRPHTVGASSAYSSRSTNWQKRSGKISLKFLAGGFPDLMVEGGFQALPETSNIRFYFAEKSGTGLICDWQNF